MTRNSQSEAEEICCAINERTLIGWNPAGISNIRLTTFTLQSLKEIVINKRQYPTHFYTDGDLWGIFVNWTDHFCIRRTLVNRTDHFYIGRTLVNLTVHFCIRRTLVNWTYYFYIRRTLVNWTDYFCIGSTLVNWTDHFYIRRTLVNWT